MKWAFCSIFTFLLAILKMTDHIEISWLWVASPFWINFGLYISFWSLIALFAAMAFICGGKVKVERKDKKCSK